MPVIVELFSLISLTWIVTRSKIFQPIRDFFNFNLLKCDQCLGFWVGATAGWLFSSQWKEILILALSTSGLGFISSRVFPAIQIRKDGKVPPLAQ